MNRRARGGPAVPAESSRLDDESGFDDAEPDGIDWMEDDGADELAARPRALPAPTTRHRLASLLLIGAVLWGTGYLAEGVYHRDMAAESTAGVASDELILTSSAPGGLSLSRLAEHAAASLSALPGRPHAAAAIAVTLVNRSPGSITVLPGATLLGVGLSESSLTGGAGVVLAPKQAIVLRGYVTADCAPGRPDRGAAAETSLMVSAQTSGGGLGVSTVALDAGGGSLRDRICAARNPG